MLLPFNPQYGVLPKKSKGNFTPLTLKLQQMQILRYMGNKRGLLSWLIPQLTQYIKPGDIILDLFAGTSSVGYALKSNMKIIANDVQAYSYEISRSLLIFNKEIHKDEFGLRLERNYIKNLVYLQNIYKKPLQTEKILINKQNYSKYFDFCLHIPSYGNSVKNDIYKIEKYTREEYIANKRKNSKTFPYILFTTYYVGSFFSLEQCIEIDSIRYAIDQITDRERRSVYLSCLIYAISKAVNSTGHFAEFFKPNSHKRRQLIVEHRSFSVMNYFLRKLDEFGKIVKQLNWSNKVFNYDYKNLISYLKANKIIKDVKLIYIDPPYTTAQYSRYYHIPETLVKYDYPKVTLSLVTKKFTDGKYRDGRYQSLFSQITLASNAFSEMFELLSKSSAATLAISYSDNSLIHPIEKLIELASKYYLVTNVSNGYVHSAQGSKFSQNGKGNKEIHEHLLICKLK